MASFIHSLDDIIGHKYVIQFLKEKIKKDSVPNVILLNGNAGIGKTSIAKILAISINNNQQSLYQQVIEKNLSTDCIKLFNMSDIGDNTDIVVQELQGVQFSSTDRKVVILDEVHGMTKKAQDAILVTLEYLPSGVYVIMCTTDIGLLRASLISRAITFNLNNLSYNEIKTVIKNKINERKLQFDIPLSTVLNLISTWSFNQPRNAINLIESFEPNTLVQHEHLQAFVPTDSVKLAIHVIDYLYGSLTRGIDFISTLSITRDFLTALLEVLKVALGGTSWLVTNEESKHINYLLSGKNLDNLINFVTKVNSYNNVSQRVFISKFIENHMNIYNKDSYNLKPTNDIGSVTASDQRTIADNYIERIKEEANLTSSNRDIEVLSSIDSLFDNGLIINDDI